MTESCLIDEIYEAAVVPSMWQPVLQKIAEKVGGFGGLLFILSQAQTDWIASPGAVDLWEGFRIGGWLKSNERAARLLKFNHPGWVHDLDLFTLEELNREPV